MAQNDAEEKKLARLRKEQKDKKGKGLERNRLIFKSGFAGRGADRSDRGFNRYKGFGRSISHRFEKSSSSSFLSVGSRRQVLRGKRINPTIANVLDISPGIARNQKREGRGGRKN